MHRVLGVLGTVWAPAQSTMSAGMPSPSPIPDARARPAPPVRIRQKPQLDEPACLLDRWLRISWICLEGEWRGGSLEEVI
jgi:hypothetical protein